jgi:FkbM family methyltransferase
VPPSASYSQNDSYLLTRDNTTFKINRSDYVQWRIFYGVRDNALRYARQCVLSDGVVLDIGANCGAFSLKLATYAAEHNLKNFQIHAFEPNPTAFGNFKYNLSLNPNIEHLVRAHEVGFGSETGEKAFQYPASNSGLGKVLPKNFNGQRSVAIRRLDDFITNLDPPRIAFVKLIVEGYEPEVFKGGWKTIEKYKPPIFFEVTEDWYKENNSSTKEVLEHLRDLGYGFKGEYYNELVSYDKQKFSSLYQYNILADINFNRKP